MFPLCRLLVLDGLVIVETLHTVRVTSDLFPVSLTSSPQISHPHRTLQMLRNTVASLHGDVH